MKKHMYFDVAPNNSRVKSNGFLTTVWLKKFDGFILYFKQNELIRCFLKSGESQVEPKFQNGCSPTREKKSYKKTQMIFGFRLIWGLRNSFLMLFLWLDV